MLSLNNIQNNTEYGIYKFAPDINWHDIASNYDKIERILNPIEQLNDIQKYVHRAFELRINDYNRYKYLSYRYVSKVAITDNMYPEMDALILDMTTNHNCTGRLGVDKICNTRTWTNIAPILRGSAILSLQSLVFESFNNDCFYIYYINREIPKKLIELLECVSCSGSKQLDDNTVLINCANNSSVLLLSGEYSKETLSQHIQEFLNIPEQYRNDDFITKDLTYTPTGDSADAQLQSLVSSSLNRQNINKLLQLDKSIEQFSRDYSGLLRERELVIEQVQSNINLCIDIKSLKDTLNKMSNTIKWSVKDDFRFNTKILELEVTTPLFNYDERIIKKLVDNGRIFDYFDERSWYIKLIKDCFIDNTKQFMTQTIVRVSLDQYVLNRHPKYHEINERRIQYHASYWRELLQQTYMPNPHISRFNCWGQNNLVLVRLLKERKWEEFLYCLQATLGNINFNDITVFEYFVNVLKTVPNDFVMCRDVATGKDLTKEDLIKEYKQNEENKDN